VRHPDAILMLRLALLRFSIHLFDQYFRDSVLELAPQQIRLRDAVARRRWGGTPSTEGLLSNASSRKA
ncbi:MAG: hypothetical protein ACPGN3_16985, partial [Opitutales bacterium]